MSEHGFIDYGGPTRRKADRLDALLNLLLPTLDISVLSPDAQRLLADLRSGDPAREHRAAAEVNEMATSDHTRESEDQG